MGKGGVLIFVIPFGESVFSTVPLAVVAYFDIYSIPLMMMCKKHHQHTLRNVVFACECWGQ
jgi:hypothetical protein